MFDRTKMLLVDHKIEVIGVVGTIALVGLTAFAATSCYELVKQQATIEAVETLGKMYRDGAKSAICNHVELRIV